MADVLIYKIANGAEKKVGRKKIIVTRYPSIKKDVKKLKDFLEQNEFYLYKYDFSPTTKSYYFEGDNNDIDLEIRISNHTKPDDLEYTFLRIEPFINKMKFESSVINKNDFNEMFAYLTTLVNSYK